MAPREATNPFPDQYLSIDYDNVGPIVLPHMENDVGLNGNGGGTNGNVGGGDDENEEVELEDGLLNDLAAAGAGGQGAGTQEGTTGGVESMDEGVVPMNTSQEDESMTLEPQVTQGTMTTNTTPPGHIGENGVGGNGLPNEVHLPNNIPQGRRTRRNVTRRPGGHGAGTVPPQTHNGMNGVGNHGTTHPGHPGPRYNIRNSNMSFGSDDADPLAIDMTDATEEEENAWAMANALFLDAAMAASSDAANHRNSIVNQNGNVTLSVGAGTGTNSTGFSHVSSSGHHGATRGAVSGNTNHGGVGLPSLTWMNGRGNNSSHPTQPNLQLPLHPAPSAQGTNSQTSASVVAPGTPRFVRPPAIFTHDAIMNPSSNPHIAPPPPPNQGSILPSTSMNQRRHFFRNRAGSLASVLDQDPSLDSCEDEEDMIQSNHSGGHGVNEHSGMNMNTITDMTELSTPYEQGMETTLPDLDTTIDTATFLDTTQDTITTNMTDNGNIELLHGDESFTTAPSSPPPSPLRPSPISQNNMGSSNSNTPMSISYADRAVSSGSQTTTNTTSPSGNSGRGIVTSLTNASANTTRAMSNLTSHVNGTGNDSLTLSPVRRPSGAHGVSTSNQQYAAAPTNIVTDEDSASNSSNSNGYVSPLQTDAMPGTPTTPSTTFGTPHGTPTPNVTTPGGHLLQSHLPSPHRRTNSSVTSSSGRSIRWNPAFEASGGSTIIGSVSESSLATDGTYLHSGATSSRSSSNTSSGNHINLTFGPNTTVSDLKYFAERGCIVPLLRALTTPRLKTLGTRMLADYAKMPQRRVAVASNKRILEFCCRTMLEMPWEDEMGTEWPAREYAVETVRSLTATEDSDSYLMGCTGLLKTLAVVARGGPFARSQNGNPRATAVAGANGNSASINGNLHPLSTVLAASTTQYNFITTIKSGLVSGKARLHACIAIMNLSCGKANKIDIASHPEVLEAMRDVMMADPDEFAPATSSPPLPNSSSSNATPESVAEEARLKAATCIKNLSNADANDTALIRSPGLLEALGYVASKTCTSAKGPSNSTTNSCLALMNLSIAKGNKHKVFQTKGVMDALMTVITYTVPTSPGETVQRNANNEARIKACSALSNLAIGYENKIPMFNYPGFVKAILKVIDTDSGEARTKACSILWSFAAEIRNQVPVVQRGDILPMLVRVAEEDHSTEARFKCVAALTLLAESLDNALPLLHCGALHPLMDILHDAGADPTQWKGQTASWCVGFLMNIAQSDDAVPFLREAGVVELLAPLLTLDHYQSLKAAMAVTFVCRYDEDDETYDLLRKTENVIPKIISLLHNTLSGRGGNGYKYGVFTLRSSVGCISSLASGPEFMKERIATGPVFESLLKVLSDFCVNGGQKGAIVGGGRDDTLSATLAVQALKSLTEYLIPIPGSSTLPFGEEMDKKLLIALKSFETFNVNGITDKTRKLAKDAHHRIDRSQDLVASGTNSDSGSVGEPSTPVRSAPNNIIENSIVASLVQGCCIGPSVHSGDGDEGFFPPQTSTTRLSTTRSAEHSDGDDSSASVSSRSVDGAVRTFLLTDSRTGRRFAVPIDPSGGRAFNDGRIWCYRRGRFCRPGESPDPNFHWTDELQAIYSAAITSNRSSSVSSSSQGSSESRGATAVTPDRTNGSSSSHMSSTSGNRGVPAVTPLRQTQK